MSNYKQGIYNVKNKDKYKGIKNPRYMSGWELHVFEYIDKSPHVICWSSEIIIVPYYSHMDQKKRKYLVDLYVEYNVNGNIIKELIEIKPSAQTQPPKKRGKKKQSTYLKEVYTYNVNIDKWKAASLYAKQRGWTFRLLTEKDIFK
jgi:hypothetical protein